MRRKRKVPIVDEEKENDLGSQSQATLQLANNSASTTTNSTMHHGPMYTIMSNVQLNETFHKKYIKEMQQLYARMDHDAFMFTFIKMIKSAMEADENNDFAYTTLIFCAKFVSSYDGEDTHLILVDISKWLLTTISNNPHIRFRLCQFVNMILNALGAEAALDDIICDNIMEYMLARLRDVSPSVRVQAILALQRLQIPDNPDDPVLRSYQFHLCSDPSPRVRQAVVTSMGRNYNTIPYILDRLWDIDEKVRRHTYLHMSSYPVKSYKVSQRLMLMEQGLNDRSEMVRKVVITIMLQQWIESYQKNLILLVSGLKLDSNEAEIDRFRKITKLTLKEIFKRQSKEELIACIPLEEDGEFHRCVPHGKLTIEISLYWQCLTEHFQVESSDELDLIVPELSAFCAYVERYCQSQKDEMDKFEQMEFQYILLSLMEILYTFDLGDEIGRENLLKLLTTIVKSYNLDEKIIEVIVKCSENLVDNQDSRLQHFVDIIQEICDFNTKQYDLVHDRNLINELMSKSSDAVMNLKLSSLKVKILDLEEQEMNFVQKKDYANAQKIRDEKNACSEEYSNLLKPLLEQHSTSDSASLPLPQTKKVTNESVLKCLRLAYFMVVSRNVHSLTPNVCKLYNDFICRHIASNQIAIRDWALKCGAAYCMLYESLAKDVFEELYSQFYKNHNIRIWKTSIAGIFELLDRYGMDNLVVQEAPNKSKKTGRMLYNTLEILDNDEETGASATNQGVDVIFMMSHFLDTCDDACIVSAIVNGFCRLILRGHIKSGEIIEKLLLRYFNPATDDEINQILGVFLENLIQRKKQDLLYPCLLPTVCTVLCAPYDSPLQEIKPETIMRFVIDATRQEFCLNDLNIHNKLAETFLQEIQNNVDNKELCKLLAKEITTLELNLVDHQSLKKNMKDATEKLIKCDFDPKTIKNVIVFKDMLDGVINPVLNNANQIGSDDEDKSDDETVTTGAKEKESSEAQNDNTIDLTNAPSSEVALITAPETEHKEDNTPINSPARVSKVLSPSASAPTTYGRENRVGLRCLRKSLNTSRTNSISESGDGPSRPAKIRIEARIDSDKKAPEATEQKKVASENSRARRNLRRNMIGEGGNQTDEALAITLVDQTTSAGPAVVGNTRTSPEAIQAVQSQKQNVRKKQNQEKMSSGNHNGTQEHNITSPRRTRRNAATPVTRITKEKARARKSTVIEQLEPVAEVLNNSEVIPASPNVEEIRHSTTRMRRMVVSRMETLRETRNTTSQDAITKSPKTSRNNSRSSMQDSSRQAFISTPLRNGRKRVLTTSPNASIGSDSNCLSPLRKYTKIDKSSSIPSPNGSKSLQEAGNSQIRPNAASKPSTSDLGSPSSTKENEIAITNKQSIILDIVSSLSSNTDENNDGDAEVSSQSDEVSQNTEKNKADTPKSITEIQRRSLSKRPAMMSLDHHSSPTVRTRNFTRMDRQSKMVMTRKRMSLESHPASSTSSVKVGITSRQTSEASTSKTNSTSYLRPPSKIPVRTLVHKVSSSSILSETTSTSSAAEESSSSVSTNRKILISKMTRINLASSKGGGMPVPMRIARPRRAPTPSYQGPSGSRISQRRHI